jgi:hypothetical protein
VGVRADRGADQVELTPDDARLAAGQRAGGLANALEQHQHIDRAHVAADGAGVPGPFEQVVERAHDLCLRRADLVVGQERVRHRFEQAPVELLAPRDFLDEAEQRLAGIRRVEQRAPVLRGLAHSLDHNRRDQVPLGREIAEQRPPADAGPLRDLGHADI